MYKDKAKPLQGTHTSQSSHWNQSRLTPFNSANHKPGSPATWTGLASIDAQIPHNRSPITIPNQKGKEESHTTTGRNRRGTPASSAGKRGPLAADWEDAQSKSLLLCGDRRRNGDGTTLSPLGWDLGRERRGWL